MIPRHEGGTDHASNAIPLCPNCHDEVHAQYQAGRTTRPYSKEELLKHLERTVALATRQDGWVVGSDDWRHDVSLIAFYATCLDRPAFRTNFHNELSFADFDRAMEDTILALNTGLLRSRDGTLIQRSEGKRDLVNSDFRDRIDATVGLIDEARRVLRGALSLDRMLLERDRGGPWIDRFDFDLRGDRGLSGRMDELRQEAVETMNGILAEVELPMLKAIGDWS